MPDVTTNGQQVLLNGRHLCDTHSPEDAAMIVAAFMKMSELTEEDLRNEVRSMIGIDASGNRTYAADLAEKFGISKAYLSDVLNGRRGIADRLAEAMGYERVVVFRKRPHEPAEGGR